MLFKQDANLRISLSRRWIIFTIGLLDSALFGGTVFGWPQLVYILKTEGVYADLCDETEKDNLPSSGAGSTNSSANFSESHFLSSYNSPRCDLNTDDTAGISLNKTETLPICPNQDKRFALLYTLAVLAYGTNGVIVGFMLHYAGLRLTRILAGSMLCLSFIFLAVTTADSPDWLFPSVVLLACGGNMTRLSVMQFGDLFPKFRSTAITILSGIYSASAAVFLLFELFDNIGVSRPAICYSLAAIAALSGVSSFIMPIHHVPFSESAPLHHKNGSGCNLSLTEKPVHAKQFERPLSVSLWSLSSVLHTYWFFIGLFCINSYQQIYNVWITVSACGEEEARQFSTYFSYANLLSVFVSPVGGLFTDYMVKRAKRGASSELSFMVKEVQANALPLLLTTMCGLVMYGCLMFFTPAAVFISLAAMIVVRPCLIACSTAYLRIRFPAEHFDRLLGIYSTVSSMLLFLQYPHFQWAQQQYYMAQSVAILLAALSLTNPLHLLINPLMKRAIVKRERFQRKAVPESTKMEAELESGLVSND